MEDSTHTHSLWSDNNRLLAVAVDNLVNAAETGKSWTEVTSELEREALISALGETGLRGSLPYSTDSVLCENCSCNVFTRTFVGKLLASAIQGKVTAALKEAGISVFEYKKREWAMDTSSPVTSLYMLQQSKEDPGKGTDMVVAYPAMDDSVMLKEYYTTYSFHLNDGLHQNLMSEFFGKIKELYKTFVTDQKAKWAEVHRYALSMCEVTKTAEEYKDKERQVINVPLRLFSIRSKEVVRRSDLYNMGKPAFGWFFESIQSYSEFLSTDPSPLEVVRREDGQRLLIRKVSSSKN